MESNDSAPNSSSTEALTVTGRDEIELTQLNRPSVSSSPIPPPTPTTAPSIVTVQPPPSVPRLMLPRPDGLGFDMMDSEYDSFRFFSNADVKPTKAEVLHYFVHAETFSINRINHDMQITDDDGYPLFDSYVDVDFCNRIWRLEAYGKVVLTMREPLSWCSELTRMRIPMYDWNGDFFGALVPGDPFIIFSAERQVVAKIIPHRTPIVDTDEVVIAPNAAIPTKPCWLCVLEGSGRHIARLEDYQFIQFNKDVGFQLKLLTLAAVVRLVGQLNPVNNFTSLVKYVFNCCATGY